MSSFGVEFALRRSLVVDGAKLLGEEASMPSRLGQFEQGSKCSDLQVSTSVVNAWLLQLPAANRKQLQARIEMVDKREVMLEREQAPQRYLPTDSGIA